MSASEEIPSPLPQDKACVFTPEKLLEIGSRYARSMNLSADLFDDAVQEFAVAVLQAERKQPHAGSGYLINAGKWAVLNFLKKENRLREFAEAAVDVSDEEVLDNETADPFHQLLQSADFLKLKELYLALPRQERLIIRRVIFDGLFLRDIANQLSMNRHAVRKTLKRALGKLRAEFLPAESLSG